MRIAVATEDFGGPLRAAIASAGSIPRLRGLRLNARTEVRAGEFTDTGLRQLRLLVEERQLRVAGLFFPTRRELCDPVHLDERLSGIRAAVPMVRKLGATDLLLRIGRIPDPTDVTLVVGTAGPSNESVDSLRNPFSFAPKSASPTVSGPTPAEQYQTMCSVLNDLAAESGRDGVTLQLMVNPLPPDRGQRLLQTVSSGPVRLVFDPAACVMAGQSPVGVYRSLYSDVGYIRGRDASLNSDAGGVEVAVGQGTVDWTELLATVSESGYDGWMCIERTGGDSRADDVRRSCEQLRPLLPAMA